jgi:hypothetical protein
MQCIIHFTFHFSYKFIYYLSILVLEEKAVWTMADLIKSNLHGCTIMYNSGSELSNNDDYVYGPYCLLFYGKNREVQNELVGKLKIMLSNPRNQ